MLLGTNASPKLQKFILGGSIIFDKCMIHSSQRGKPSRQHEPEWGLKF